MVNCKRRAYCRRAETPANGRPAHTTRTRQRIVARLVATAPIRHSMFGWRLNCHPNESLCPLSLWERVRVRAAFGAFIHAANRPHPRPLSRRERGVFLSLLGWQLNCHPNGWPLTTGHWPLNPTSASSMRSRAARAGRWPATPAWTAREPPRRTRRSPDTRSHGYRRNSETGTEVSPRRSRWANPR